MANKDELRVCFAVVGFDGDPHDITALAGMPPSKHWRKGESYGSDGAIRTHSRWAIASPGAPAAPFDSQLCDLLELLEANDDSIRKLSASFEAGISVVFYSSDNPNPGFHLSVSAVERIQALGLSVDFDIYCLGE